jgi:hypothetical protein
MASTGTRPGDGQHRHPAQDGRAFGGERGGRFAHTGVDLRAIERGAIATLSTHRSEAGTTARSA